MQDNSIERSNLYKVQHITPSFQPELLYLWSRWKCLGRELRMAEAEKKKKYYYYEKKEKKAKEVKKKRKSTWTD